jgi:CubicO group peptidase (beta-lactamase class C family)
MTEATVPQAGSQRSELERQARAAVDPLLPKYANAAVVVGIVTPTDENFFGFGQVAAAYPTAPDRHTRFDIGSITKVFTGLVLAEMVVRGEVRLGDPTQAYLPASLTTPRLREVSPTLLDFATHTSGLSDLPWDMPSERRARGEVVREEESIGHASGTTYGRERLAVALQKETLSISPGSKYHYSSLGYGLLGIALSERAGLSLGELYRARVGGPLGLRDTHLYAEDTSFDARFAEGHDEKGKPVWFRRDEEALAACCGLRSSASDLALLARAHLQSVGPLAEAVRLARTPQRAGGFEGGHTYRERMGLGWHVMHQPEGRLYKFGRMAGHVGLIEVDPVAQRGIVILAAHHTFPLDVVLRALLPRPTLAYTAKTQVVAGGLTATAPIAAWDAGLQLVSMQLSSESAVPGETLELRMGFTTQSPIGRDLRLFVQLDGDAGRSSIDHSPTLPTSAWPQQGRVEHVLRFVVPEDYPTTEVRVWAGLYDASGRVKVTAGDTDGSQRVRGPACQIRAGQAN